MNTTRVGALALCVCLAASVVVGAQSPSSAQGQPGSVPVVRVSEPMTVERLMALKVPRVCDFRGAVYVDGVHPDSPGPWGNLAQVVGAGGSAGRFPLQAHVGDLTGNGVADGLMVIECTMGASGYVNSAFVYRSDGHRIGRIPVERFVPSFGYAPIYPEATIRNGTIRMTVASFGPDDAHCCPSITTHLRLRWNGLRFVRV